MTAGPGTPLARAISRAHQIAYITSDLDLGIEHWGRTTGNTQFRIVAVTLRLRVDDRTVDVSLDAAFFDGDVQIEIFRAATDAPEFLTAKASAAVDSPPLRLHHLGTFTDDLEAVVQQARQAGLRVVDGSVPGVLDVAFIDLTATTGHWLECLRRHR